MQIKLRNNYYLILQYRYYLISILVIVGIFILSALQNEIVTKTQSIYALFIVLIGVLPAVSVLINKNKDELIPVFPLHALFYAVTFGMVIFSSKYKRFLPQTDFSKNIDWAAFHDPTVNSALLMTIVGLISLNIGYYGFRKFFRNIKPIQNIDVSVKKQIVFSWAIFSCYLLLQLYPNLRALPSISQLDTSLVYFSLGILTLLNYDRQLSVWHLIFFRIAQVYALSIAISSGSLAPIVLMLVFFGVLYWGNKRQFPWHIFVSIIIVVVILNPVKAKFREITWYSSDEKVSSYFENTRKLVNTTINYYSNKNLFSEIKNDDSVINRLSNISLFSYVVYVTPEYVPYWNGETYRTLWTSFIPRALWPDKPQSTIGQDFGHRYYLLNKEDRGTSINLPWLIEFYVNFGKFGIIPGMFFVGIFFRVLLQKFNVPVRARMEYVFVVTITFGLFFAESNFALMVGGILPKFVVFFFLMRLLTISPIVKRY